MSLKRYLYVTVITAGHRHIEITHILVIWQYVNLLQWGKLSLVLVIGASTTTADGG